jgi:hypothetical protein
MMSNTLAPFSLLYQPFSTSNDDRFWDFTNSTLFSVNEDILNRMLANLTLSAITTFNLWSTHVNQTRMMAANTYSFSHPLSLILPYYLTLLCALPLLILGFCALYANGVPATDGGFLQLLTTTRGSATLDSLAIGGCLGGHRNVPSELRDLKIQYGEMTLPPDFRGAQVVIPRAGFGTEDEVLPLRKGHVYGG